MDISNPLDLGFQIWFDDRLVELSITEMDDLYSIPVSISNLNQLEKLILKNNRIIHIPYSVCDLNIDFLDSSFFNINGNLLCPNDVPNCIVESLK